jgi:MerR family transcriptional regulator/heat shock protein HspR
VARARARVTFDVTNPDAPVFVISVAAELTGMHPQTLRGYDRLGLVSPGRAGGGGRRYSLRDIETLQMIAELTSAGIGIEGVRRILELEAQLTVLQARIAELESELADAARAGAPNLPVLRRAADVTRYIGPFGPRRPAATKVYGHEKGHHETHGPQ